MRTKKLVASNFEKKHGYLVIDGKYFRSESVDGRICFVIVSKAEIKQNQKMADAIAEKLKESLDAKKVLNEAIMTMHTTEIKRLYKMIQSKRKYKKTTREHACVDMKIGNFILPIIE